MTTFGSAPKPFGLLEPFWALTTSVVGAQLDTSNGRIGECVLCLHKTCSTRGAQFAGHHRANPVPELLVVRRACTDRIQTGIASSLTIPGNTRSRGGRGKPPRGQAGFSELASGSVGTIPWSAAAKRSNIAVRRWRVA
jgi:hypothetical protein